jgi:ATP-dependent protease ClpP protease subunit
MNTRTKLFVTLLFIAGMFSEIGFTDTFTNKETGETFFGFVTQKSTGSRTLVYNNDKSGLMSINLNDYEVVLNSRGRKDNVVVVPITQSEVLLSEVVSEKIAQTIIDASNKGPQAIIVRIDNPGGRGDYMKIITSAITQTNNCPVAAYISGEQYGGAFSSAALIAQACDKIYISPTASIGAIGPYSGAAVTDQEFADYIATYCSDSLASYSIYATALAHERNRPALLVRALIDKGLSVEEVTTIDGRREFIQKDDRQPTQTRVRTLAEGVGNTNPQQPIPQGQIVNAVLNLPPTVAVEVGLVDKIVNSLNGVLTEMNLEDVKLTNASDVENMIKKYSAARRNIAESLSRIQWLEDRAAVLEDQLTEIETQLRTGTVTREVTRGNRNPYRRSTVPLPDNYYGYYYDPGITSRGRFPLYGNRYITGGRKRSTRETETVVTQLPNASAAQVQRELVVVLNDLIVQYRRVMSQAKRWPGGLPPDIPYQTLQQNNDTAVALRDYLLSQSFPGQPGVQQPVPVAPPATRRNGY